MATHIHHPRITLAPAELDRYLEGGWRPTGQSIYTADYLRTDDDELHGCLQLRLPLTTFKFKKRHAKLLRRNGARFHHTFAPAALPDKELLAVNRKYMVVHPDKTREDLEYNVVTEEGARPINTWICRVYEENKLVAFSYFDLGQRVMYTKSGIYDPAYARASLGVYTMLLEVNMALELGHEFYYPGYYSPTYPAFDYKRQMGPMEYRDITTGTWLALSTEADRQPVDPLTVNRNHLQALAASLTNSGIRVKFKEYPSFTGRFRPVGNGENVMLDAPQLLLIGHQMSLNLYWVATYHNDTEEYHFDQVRTANLYDMRVLPFSEKGTPRFTTPVVVHRHLLNTSSIDTMVRVVKEQLAGG